MNIQQGNVAGQKSTRIAGSAAEAYVLDQESEGVIRQSLSDLGMPDIDIITGTVETAIAALTLKPSPRLLLVDVSGVDDPVSRVRALAEVCEPQTGVVVIGDRNDIVLYRNLKYAGIVDYFFKPLVGPLVRSTCNRILTGEAEEPTTRAGRLVFVIGVRGGVGTTTIAVNSAWYLAENRQRWVMLLDLDLQNGDAALQLDTTPSHALREALEHPERVDKLFLERAVIHVDQRLDLLASLDPLGDNVGLREDATLAMLEKLLDRYRFVFVDLPSPIATMVMGVLRSPSTCVLVSDASLASARDVARWREQIGPNSHDRTTLHILNKSGAADSLPEADFIRAAGGAPDIVIPYDREIAARANLGIHKGQDCAALKRGLAPLLNHLAGEPMKAPVSLLRRIFG